MKFIIVLCLSLLILPNLACADENDTDERFGNVPPVSERSLEARKRQLGTAKRPGPLALELSAAGFTPGDAVFIRIFKQQVAPEYVLTPAGKGVLEVWLQKSNRPFSLFKTYKIAAFSGVLGPKLEEGDKQSPEGFYSVTPDSLNPNSSYHLSMNIGYPNDYDIFYGRTGSYIMIHGSSVSVGCFAMTNPLIEEIYILAESAFLNKQSKISVHVFPFPLTSANMDEATNLPWLSFWQNLKDGYDFFENHRSVPQIKVINGEYVFGAF